MSFHHGYIQVLRKVLLVDMGGSKEIATKMVTEMLYPDTGQSDPTGLLVDIMERYQGGNAALEGAMQEVGRRVEWDLDTD